jgi:hypothetical protein
LQRLTTLTNVESMAIEDELLALEDQGWQALSSDQGADFYDELMSEDVVMLLPFGALDRAACLEAIRSAPPWLTYSISDARVLRLSADWGVVIYRATASREGQPEYRALMSSSYVRRDGAWELVLHQQTLLQA